MNTHSIVFSSSTHSSPRRRCITRSAAHTVSDVIRRRSHNLSVSRAGPEGGSPARAAGETKHRDQGRSRPEHLLDLHEYGGEIEQLLGRAFAPTNVVVTASAPPRDPGKHSRACEAAVRSSQNPGCRRVGGSYGQRLKPMRRGQRSAENIESQLLSDVSPKPCDVKFENP